MWHDERRDVIESTRAALDYLQKLHDMFGDWHLALASYNWGEGAVSRAIEKNRRAGKPTGYTSLKMPQETAYYVPKLQAIKNIVSEPERWGVALPRIDDAPYFVAVPKTRDIDVDTAARLAEMNTADFRALNPAFNRPVIVGAAGVKLLLPADKVDAFHANLAAWEATGQPLASWTTYQMAPSDTIASVAKRAGISEQQLREANRVPPRYRLAPGSTILIPRDETMEEDIPAASLEARFALVPEQPNLRKVTYRVRRGDTLHAVARKLERRRKGRHRLEPPDRADAVRGAATRTHRSGSQGTRREDRGRQGHRPATRRLPRPRRRQAPRKGAREDVAHEVGRQAGAARRAAFPGARLHRPLSVDERHRLYCAPPRAGAFPHLSVDTHMGFLQGKRLLITGVLSNRSIAYGIAQACKREGAELAFTYVGDRFKERITEIAAEFGSDAVLDMDVTDDAQIDAAFGALRERWGGLDGLVHSIGFAPREAIAGDFLDGLSRENFRIAHDVSAYSFPALAKAALPADGRPQRLRC